jgi:hypothetical protein
MLRFKCIRIHHERNLYVVSTNKELETVTFELVYDEDDKHYWSNLKGAASADGPIHVRIVDPALQGKYKIGDVYVLEPAVAGE